MTLNWRENLLLMSVPVLWVLTVWGAWSRGVDEGWQRAVWSDRQCIVSAPPVCYERWHSLTVPTCDGGTQTMVER